MWSGMAVKTASRQACFYFWKGVQCRCKWSSIRAFARKSLCYGWAWYDIYYSVACRVAASWLRLDRLARLDKVATHVKHTMASGDSRAVHRCIGAVLKAPTPSNTSVTNNAGH
eukprot:580881-Karenia_brevis.AAC.1